MSIFLGNIFHWGFLFMALLRIFMQKSSAMKHIPLYCFLLILILSCSESSVTEKLDSAEQCMNDSPDNALSILEEIPQDDLSSMEVKARYSLLMSMALDKNYIDVKNDSLVSVAVRYYSRKKDPNRRMKAHYYKGIVQKNAGNYPAAIISLEKAQRDAEDLKDYYYLGLISNNKGYIYNSMANRAASLKNAKQAVEYFQMGGYDLHVAYALLTLAINYYNSKEYDKALEVLNREELQQYNLHQKDVYKLLRAAISIEKESEAEQTIRLYNSIPQSSYDIQDYGYLAAAYEKEGKRDSADYWINQGYLFANTSVDSAAIHYMFSQILAARGFYPSAYSLIDKAMATQDSFTQTVLEESLNVALKEYYQDELVIEEAQRKHERERLVWIILMISLLSFSFVCYLIAKVRKKDRDLTEKMARFATIDSALQEMQRSNATLVGSLFSERLLRLNTLSRQFFQTDEKGKKEIVFNAFKKDLEAFQTEGNIYSSLERDLNTFCNNVVEKLKSQVPRIRGENLQITMLFFSGFPYEAIQLITKRNSIESLKMLRSRIRNEIKSANAPDAQLFLEMLEMKRQKKRSPNNQTNDC